MTDATTFDIFAFVEGQGYPEDTVRVYTDQKSVYEIDKLEAAIADELDQDRVDELASEVEALTEKVRESSLVFSLRGIPTPVLLDVEKRLDAKYGEQGEGEVNRERHINRMSELVALSILHVENNDGAKDTRQWDKDTMQKLFETLPNGQGAKLIDAAIELTLRARTFENYTVTPDFL